jgi:hypothetical protein
LANIEDLVSALSVRIDQLDEEEAQAVSQVPKDDSEREAMEAAAEERREKRLQLELLKENVTVLAGNIQTLVEKAQGDGEEDDDHLLLISDDMEKIESVITETATMLMMLSQSEEETVLANHDLIQEDEQGLAIEESVRLEDQISAVNAMVSNIELLSLADELLGVDSFEGIEFTDLSQSNLEITRTNFKAEDPNKRPEYWKEVRMRRIVVKEYVDRLEGLDEATLKEKRAMRIVEVPNYCLSLVSGVTTCTGGEGDGRRSAATRAPAQSRVLNLLREVGRW